MFKKLAKNFVVFLIVMVFAVSSVACNKVPNKEASYDVWTTWNTMKVVREAELNGNYDKMAKGINVKMAKAESEMGSFYVTTGDVGVESFNLGVQDLKNSNGDIFSVDNMKVYAQKYIEVSWRSRNNTYEEYPLGCYTPDALVEIDLYRKAKEDKILPNSNQGFTVDFKTTADTPAGVYTGEFYLVLDGQVIDIPVSVTVWDYSVPLEAISQSCNLIYEDSIMQGEMTSVQSEVDDWYRIYYEVALEYRQNPYMVPESTKSPEKFVANVVKYSEHPNFTSFGLPHQTFLGKYSGTYQEVKGIFLNEDGTTDTAKVARYGDCMNYWYECLYLLGWEAKKNNKNYFEECYIYPIDEPNDAEALKIAKEWFEDLEALRDDVADALVRDGVFPANHEVIASVRDINIVCTALGDEPELAGYDIVYVPEPYEIEDYSIQTGIEEHAKNNDGNPIWYYTQIDKIGDGPNHFLDDFMIAGRIQGWMEKYYNIDGWLYWEFAMYLAKIAFVSGYEVVNPYEDMNRDAGSATGCAGGGYWVYPASRYGASEPIKTLRLLTLRDSYEEKETLYYLDGIYSEYEDYYGVDDGEFDINRVFKGVYDRIFTRSAAFRDDEIFDSCRESLKDAVINANKGENKFVYTMDYVGKDATYSFYTAPGYQVKVGDTILSSTASGQGLKHTYTIDASKTAVLASVEIIKDGKTTTMELYEASTEKAVDIMSDSFEVSVSGDSQFTKTEKGYDFTIKSDSENDYFIPQIKFTGVPSVFKSIEIDIENTTDTPIAMYLRIVYSSGTSELRDIGLQANSKRTIEALCRSANGSTISSIAIRFDNIDVNMNTLPDRTISVTGMRVR